MKDMEFNVNEITAVILAGGKNSRIKQEKSLLKIDGIHLIEKQIGILKDLFVNIMISTNKPVLRKKFSDYKIVEDKYKNCGPLAGVHSALLHCQTKAVFAFACDMPYLNKELLLRQVEIFRKTNSQIIVPRHSEGIEPLHAIYSVETLPHLESCLKNGHFSVRSFYEYYKTGYMDVTDSEIKYFFNINTPSDLDKIAGFK